GTGDLIASSVAGSYDEMQFVDAAIAVHVSDLRRPSLEYRINVPTTTLANGLKIEDFHTRARHDGENITFFDSRMRALGGIIRLPTTEVDVNHAPYMAVLHIEDVDVGRLLKLLEQEGLSGSGSLSGQIPLAFYADHVVVDAAVLRNTTAGNLRYAPLTTEAPEQIDNIALKALEDFRYTVIKMELDYDREGNYVIKTRLEGQNPDLYDGYPIAFNLNITGTLPGLLRSSLLSGDFSGNVLKSINKNP
ncbi:MAG: YdbH domain-containing protein, partial [Gammaproteobacteria bacterium]|nr:YdbH domain-containing protein [Gammaproteobacteria bacterium]